MSNNKIFVSVVDDDFYIAKLFYEALRQNIDEIEVFCFTDPVSAFEHFTENRENFALVISDLKMPGLNGLELLKKVKSFNPESKNNIDECLQFRGRRIV